MKQISRRSFFKKLGGLTAVAFVSPSELTRLDEYFKGLEFDPTQRYRHAVQYHNPHKQEDKIAMRNKALCILLDYIDTKIPKMYWKRIVFIEQFFDWDIESGIAFWYCPEAKWDGYTHYHKYFLIWKKKLIAVRFVSYGNFEEQKKWQ